MRPQHGRLLGRRDQMAVVAGPRGEENVAVPLEYTRRLLEAIPNPFQDAPRPGDSMAG